MRTLLVALSLMSGFAFAEKAPLNVHLEPTVGTGLNRSFLMTGITLKINVASFEVLAPFAPQLECFGMSALNNTFLARGNAFGAGIGARLRLFNDERGFFFNPGTQHTGNWWGNYWIDAHFVFSTPGVGFDVGMGYEFSAIDSLSIGPSVQFRLLGPHIMLAFGLSFTVGIPQTTPAESDFDNDGIPAHADECPNEPEDKDGIKDEDGCPDDADAA